MDLSLSLNCSRSPLLLSASRPCLCSFSLSVTLSVTRSLSVTHSLSHRLSLSRSHSRLPQPVSLSLSLSQPLSLSLTRSLLVIKGLPLSIFVGLRIDLKAKFFQIGLLAVFIAGIQKFLLELILKAKERIGLLAVFVSVYRKPSENSSLIWNTSRLNKMQSADNIFSCFICYFQLLFYL